MSGSWHRRSRGHFTHLDWDRWLGGTRPIDPYLVWGDLCGRFGFARLGLGDGDNGKWPILVEMDQPEMPLPSGGGACGASEVCVVFGMLAIPEAYQTIDAGGITRLTGRFFTAQVSPACIDQLLRCTEVSALQLGLPRRAPSQLQAQRPQTKPAFARRPWVVIGVIDDGCAFAQPSFQGHDGPRVQYLWDQDRRRAADEKVWQTAQRFGYGAELRPATIRDAVSAGASDDLAPYRQTRYGAFRLDPDAASSGPTDAEGRPLPQATQRGASHGTSVLDLAAGYPPPLRAQGRILQGRESAQPRPVLDDAGRAPIADRLVRARKDKLDPLGLETLAANVDVADQWPIVFVQLPSRTVADTSGGSLAVHVLDAVRYIRLTATRIPYEDARPTDVFFPDNRVVINISWGALAGPHDGTSMIERALREQVVGDEGSPTKPAELPITFIVSAAGNGQRAGHHATFLLRPGGSETLFWAIGPDSPLESYLEVWLPERDVFDCPVHEAPVRALLVQVRTPDGRPSGPICMGESFLFEVPAGVDDENKPLAAPLAGVVFCRRVVQGKSGTMLLLAVAPTRQEHCDRRPPAPHGEWRVEITWRAAVPAEGPAIQVHAWSERSDLIYGGARAQQSRVAVRSARADSSEHDPEVQRDWRAGPRSGETRLPLGLQESHTQASLSGRLDAEAQRYDVPNSRGVGTYLTVGAYRLSDGEVSLYSGSGPGRGLKLDALWSALIAPTMAHTGALRPGADGPGDFSVANPGLRTAGTWPTSHARISGTSAAAASVTRAIASVAYWEMNQFTDAAAATNELLLDKPAPPPAGQARPTLTPRADDVLRRGRRRAR